MTGLPRIKNKLMLAEIFPAVRKAAINLFLLVFLLCSTKSSDRLAMVYEIEKNRTAVKPFQFMLVVTCNVFFIDTSDVSVPLDRFMN